MFGTEKQIKWAMEIKESYISEINQLIESMETRKPNEQGKSFIGFLSVLSDKQTIENNANKMLEIIKKVKSQIESVEVAEFFIDIKENHMLNITKIVISHF